MFGKKAEILILFILTIFSTVGLAAAADANAVVDVNAAVKANVVAEVNTAAKKSEISAVIPPAPQPGPNAPAEVNMITAAPVAPGVIDTNFGVAAPAGRGELLSPLTAKTFYDIGYELYAAKNADFLSAKQAIIFFDAAVNLDSRAGYVLPDIINIAWQYPGENFSDAVRLALNEYIDHSSDLEVSSKAVGYLLERVESREQRQELLKNLLGRYQKKNIMFASDLLTQLGLLTAETGDAVEAQTYLARAFALNKYNRLAFAKLAELADSGGQSLPDIVYLQNLRFAVRANPLDITSALRFAQYMEVLGLYDTASAAYKYCVDLLKYFNGPKAVGLNIYRPWLFNCYNVRRYDQCRSILQEIRDQGIFDVQAEAIAYAAALQSGDKQSQEAILNAIKSRSAKILSGQLKASPAQLADYVWFYSFIADVNSDQLLAWATKAYDADPNSLNAASLFAYALVVNNQTDLAAPMLEKIGATTQAAGLARAMILIQKKADANSITDQLKKVIASAPGTFEAQKAKAKLKELGSEYQSPFDPVSFVADLRTDFGQEIFGRFTEPNKMVSLQFSVKNAAFSFGSEIPANLIIMNISPEPMVISPDAMVKGNIRIDAKITGDLTAQFPALIVKIVRPSHEIRPANALFIPVRLDTGPVKDILDCHPQAELTLEFTAYIDPLADANGRIRNALPIAPAHIVLSHRKLDLNTRYLQQRLDTLKTGQQSQKTKSANLFAGLFAEQQEFRRTGPAYRFIYTEPQVLSSALAKCLSDDDWILKVQTMVAMLRLKLDYRLTQAVSAELENPNWPVRLVAVFILAQNQGRQFTPVLSWTAKNDLNPRVRQLAAILLGRGGFPDGSGNVAADSNNVSPP